MKKLLKFEFRKILRQKSLYICSGLAMLSTILNVVLSKIMSEKFSDDKLLSQDLILQSIFASSLSLLISIIISLYTCNDFSNGTLKNICSKGFSRTKIYLSKYIVSAVVTLICSIIVILLTFIAAPIVGAEPIDDPGRLIVLLLSQLVIMLGYHGVFFGISAMIASSGMSIAVNIVGPMLLFSIISIVLTVLKIDSFNINEYWLDYALSSVSSDPEKTGDIVKSIVMSIIYAAAFFTGGCLINRKREL